MHILVLFKNLDLMKCIYFMLIYIYTTKYNAWCITCKMSWKHSIKVHLLSLKSSVQFLKILMVFSRYAMRLMQNKPLYNHFSVIKLNFQTIGNNKIINSVQHTKYIRFLVAKRHFTNCCLQANWYYLLSLS